MDNNNSNHRVAFLTILDKRKNQEDFSELLNRKQVVLGNRIRLVNLLKAHQGVCLANRPSLQQVLEDSVKQLRQQQAADLEQDSG